MRELTLQSETRRRSRPGLVGRMFSWFRRSRSVEEAPETSPRPEVRDALPEEESPASRTPETAPPSIQPAELEAILDRALDRQARELEAAFERRLEETSRSLSETLTAAVQELGDRLEHQGRKHLGELEATRGEINQFRFQIESQFSSLERHESSVDQSLRFLDDSSRRLEALCREQMQELQEQADWSREAVDTIQRASQERVSELRGRHRVEMGAMKDFCSRQQDDLRKTRRSFAERLRGTSRQLERMADRNGDLTSVHDEIDRASRSHGLWQRWFLGPWKRRQERRQASLRVEELARHLKQEKEDLDELRRSLHRLAVEVLEYSDHQRVLPITAPAVAPDRGPDEKPVRPVIRVDCVPK